MEAGLSNTKKSADYQTDQVCLLRWRYVIVLALVGVMIMGVEWTADRLLAQQATDAPVINVAGRQRMLSQSIAKSAIALLATDTEAVPPPANKTRNDLLAVLHQWEHSHTTLLVGDPARGLAGVRDASLRSAYDALAPWMAQLKMLALQAANEAEHASRAAIIRDLLATESKYLVAMNHIVSMHEKSARRRLERTSWILSGFLTVIVILLATCGIGIFEPTTRSLRRALVSSEKRRQEAIRAKKAKAVFLAKVSHELRTPLTAIIGFNEVLTDTAATDESKREAAEIVRRNGEHLIGLIDDILDASKIEAGKLEVQCTPVSLVTQVRDVLGMFELRARQKQIELSARADAETFARVVADPMRLKQVLANLVGNAVKFTRTGSVAIVLGHEGAKATIEVRDTGPGIPAKSRQRIFRNFEQADNRANREHGGTGLGLSISAQLCSLMDAEISYRDHPDGGAIFRIVIAGEEKISAPQFAEQLAPASADSREKSAIAKKTADHSTLSGRVLLAEDGPDNQRLISFVLKKAGIDLTVVDDGQQAVEAAQAALRDGNAFELILMDMQMPVLDGRSATMQLRADGYKLPIVALTANASQEQRAYYLKSGCDDFASKPIKRADLLALCAKWLRGDGVEADEDRLKTQLAS